ncbi:MAG TPA: helix-turn-helix transcriptional regulator [Candidatus Acidoferrum sp.]|nr:helix-turn-helix transcriptional regulator [Candidatus Acidoferrum sp.]
MIIGDRLRAIREHRKLSQGEIQNRTGLLRSYISRVENCHTVPALETLEKLARALEIPLYAVFYDGEIPRPELAPPGRNGNTDGGWGASGKHARFLHKLRTSLSKMSVNKREVLFLFAQKLVAGKHSNGHNAAN